MAHLGRGEQHRRRIRTGGHACPAADALGGVHRAVGDVLGNRDAVGLGRAARVRGDEAARLDDAVEGRAVHHQVFQDGKARCPPRLEDECVAVLEEAHVELTDGGRRIRSVRDCR